MFIYIYSFEIVFPEASRKDIGIPMISLLQQTQEIFGHHVLKFISREVRMRIHDVL